MEHVNQSHIEPISQNSVSEEQKTFHNNLWVQTMPLPHSFQLQDFIFILAFHTSLKVHPNLRKHFH